jgi:aerobic-type carbon monoxide dehydrogenase small subunit (CoxS/CutS family)
MEKLIFELNGEKAEVEVEPHESLLHVLRRRLMLMGVKEGCGEGECGACTVLIDGEPVVSCILPAMKAYGKRITSIEGIGKIDHLHPIQEAFIEAGAVQCGFCTPGVVLSSTALLDREDFPSDAQIKEALSGHICRCTGYGGFVEAVRMAARKMQTVRHAASGAAQRVRSEKAVEK